MKPVVATIQIIGADDACAAVAVSAARRAFPDAPVTSSPELEPALQKGSEGGATLLVLLAPDAAEVQRAVTTVDPRGRPRWAVVACSQLAPESDSHLISVSREEWNESVLVRALGTAVRLQACKAINAQLHGDLRTIGRRLVHDLRSPLNCILTSNEAMKDPSDPPESPRAIFGQAIANSLDEVVSLFSRISLVLNATTNPEPRQTVNMEEIVWGALQRYESRLLKSEDTVSHPQKWPMVEGVPHWLDTIWSNLLANSLAHGGQKVRIELGWDILTGHYRFWIRDNGKGIPENMRSHLFHPFDRLNDLAAPRGFGLSLVHRLVELQGGNCGYEAQASGSGIFYFTLPPSGK